MFCTDNVKSKEFSATNSMDFKVIKLPVSEQRMKHSHKERRQEGERLRRGITPFLFTRFGLDLMFPLM